MSGRELIDLLEKLTSHDLDSEKIDGIIEYLLDFAEIDVKVSKDKMGLSISKLDTKEIVNKFSIDENEIALYIKKGMDVIGKSLKEMVINNKNPENELEKKIFNKFDVENLRLKALFKREYVMPVLDDFKVYKTSRVINGKSIKHYILKIDYDDSKTLGFELTEKDLRKIYDVIKKVLEGENDGSNRSV
ncbi:hypothetical protein JH146_0790 [Methanocaldococcus bathoardescens]|uniref:Uncharacterized protein n=1 Tax=Methanocaldococcus bathoardescens TaxID=1301915 RepID=A0A076LBV6_9EURY|nr:hypothetical protein [Methanocaldococcus bathoardescens]AIJ05636.1 hypothetical protein JH146_0790 [Methanocaldococcus bathoardescens]